MTGKLQKCKTISINFFANSRKSRQNEKSEYEERIKTKHATFTKIKENYDLKKTLRERIKERAKIEATLKLLNQQKLVLEYTDIHKKIKAGDREKVKLDEELGKAVQKKEEYEVNVVRFERQIKELERLKKIDHDRFTKVTHELAEQNQAGKLIDEIENKERKIEAESLSQAQNKQKMTKAQQEIDRLTIELNNCNNAVNLSELQIINEKIEKEKCGYEDKQQELTEQRTKMKINENKINDLNVELNKINSEDNKRLNQLKYCNQDAYDGVQWLRNNKTKFRMPDGIFEPIMTILRLKNYEYAAQLENIIGKSDLEAFVCTNYEDSNKLANNLRNQQRLRKINVVHSNPNNQITYNHPKLNTRVKHIFLDDVLQDCPKPILSHLCQKKYIHKIPIFDAQPEDDFFTNNRQVRKYFVKNDRFVHQAMSSDYHKNINTTSTPFSGDVKCLNVVSADNQRIEEIQEKIRDFKAKNDQHDNNINAIVDIMKDHERNMISLGNDNAEVERKIAYYKDLEKKLNDANQLLSYLRSAKSSETKIKELRDQIKNIILTQLIPANEDLFKLAKESAEKSVEIEKKSLQIEQLRNQMTKENVPYQLAIAEVGTIQDDIKKRSGEIAQYKNEIKRVINDIRTGPYQWESPNSHPVSMPEDLKAEIEEYCPKTLPEVKAKIADQETILKSKAPVSETEIQNMRNLNLNLNLNSAQFFYLAPKVRHLSPKPKYKT